ncbi:MAG TPA: cellulose biosynthesis protein BcsS [Hyphomicrobiaceae bacterium]|jgi:hypothetical protein
MGLALCAVGSPVAWADGEAQSDERPPPRVETWSGVEVFPGIRSVYGGASWAPFGSIREDGFRLRGAAGYGAYGLGPGDSGKGTVAFGDVLVGYHKQLGSVTIKVFGGLTVLDYAPDAAEPWPALTGTEYGGKGVLEAWWNITDQAWASLDLSWASTHMDYGSRVRLGWRLLPDLSAGLEGGSGGTAEPGLEHDTSRIGAFLRYEWATGEVSVSGGWAADGTWLEREWPPGPFGTVAVLTRF